MTPDETKTERLVIRVTPSMDRELREAAGDRPVAELVTAALEEKLARVRYGQSGSAIVGNGEKAATATATLRPGGRVTVGLGKGPVEPRPKGGRR